MNNAYFEYVNYDRKFKNKKVFYNMLNLFRFDTPDYIKKLFKMCLNFSTDQRPLFSFVYSHFLKKIISIF